jgi:HSP20 family protein
VEVSYNNGNLVVSAELPGLSEKDVKIEVNNDMLSIEGERKVEEEKTAEGVHLTERRYGRFYRAIALPEGADVQKAKADFQNGVLRITVPVQQMQQNHRRARPPARRRVRRQVRQHTPVRKVQQRVRALPARELRNRTND